MGDLLRVLAVFALVAANAFLVTAEFAVLAARRARLAPRAESGAQVEQLDGPHAVAGSKSRKTRDDESFGGR
jgi:hypothetical protein